MDKQPEGPKLEPCPFCGPGESVVDLAFDDTSQRWRVHCGRCGCSTGISPRDKTQAPAITAWNTRASIGAEERQRLADAIDPRRRSADAGTGPNKYTLALITDLIAASDALRALPAPQPTGMEDSREAFEKWYRDTYPSDLEGTWPGKWTLDRDNNGEFRHRKVQQAWREWQDACTWQARQSAAVPEGWVLVPREPTPEMMRAAGDEFMAATTAHVSGVTAVDTPFLRWYRAILSALQPRPQPASAERIARALAEAGHCRTKSEADAIAEIITRHQGGTFAAGIEAAAKWHERQAFEAEAEHPGIQGSKSQKWRKRFHNEAAAALRARTSEDGER